MFAHDFPREARAHQKQITQKEEPHQSTKDTQSLLTQQFCFREQGFHKVTFNWVTR